MAGPNVQALAVVMTKMASGNVQIVFYNSRDGVNQHEDIRFVAVIPAADFTAFNTTVNGGAAGVTLTKVYAENAAATQGDYVAADASGVPRLGVLYTGAA